MRKLCSLLTILTLIFTLNSICYAEESEVNTELKTVSENTTEPVQENAYYTKCDCYCYVKPDTGSVIKYALGKNSYIPVVDIVDEFYVVKLLDEKLYYVRKADIYSEFKPFDLRNNSETATVYSSLCYYLIPLNHNCISFDKEENNNMVSFITDNNPENDYLVVRSLEHIKIYGFMLNSLKAKGIKGIYIYYSPDGREYDMSLFISSDSIRDVKDSDVFDLSATYCDGVVKFNTPDQMIPFEIGIGSYSNDTIVFAQNDVKLKRIENTTNGMTFTVLTNLNDVVVYKVSDNKTHPVAVNKQTIQENGELFIAGIITCGVIWTVLAILFFACKKKKKNHTNRK